MAHGMLKGYLHGIVDDRCDFKKYMQRVLRLTGLCIEQRDEDLSVPPPRKFKPSEHHQNSLREAEKELERLSKMTRQERERFGEAERQKAVTSRAKAAREEEAERKFIGALAAKLEAWKPPCKEFQDTKKWALADLREVLEKEDSSAKWLKEAEEKKPIDYYKAAVDSASWNVSYHTKEIESERARCEKSNELLAKFWASIEQ